MQEVKELLEKLQVRKEEVELTLEDIKTLEPSDTIMDRRLNLQEEQEYINKSIDFINWSAKAKKQEILNVKTVSFNLTKELPKVIEKLEKEALVLDSKLPEFDIVSQYTESQQKTLEKYGMIQHSLYKKGKHLRISKKFYNNVILLVCRNI